MKSIAFLLAAALIVIIATMTFYKKDSKESSGITEGLSPVKTAIIKRHTGYVKAFSDYDLETVYAYLTPYSQEQQSLHEWEKKVLSTTKKTKREQINAIILHDDDTRAVIGVEQFDTKTTSTGGYTQTWLLIGGEWYRAYAEDHDSQTDKVVSDSEQEETTELSTLLPFSIENFSYHWELDRGVFSRSELYRPEVTLNIRNTGVEPIPYLKLMVQFYNTWESTIFANEDAYVLSSSDIPLGPGVLSNKIFLESNIGLNIKEKLKLASLNNDFAEQYIETLSEFTQSITAVLYYKTEHSSEWIIIEEYNYY